MDNIENAAPTDELTPVESDMGEVMNPDEARLDYVNSLLSDSPSEVATEPDEAPEVSEEHIVEEPEAEAEEIHDEQSSDDEHSNVEDADEAPEEPGLDDDDVDRPVVDYDEAKNFLFEIDGKEYTIDQIKAMKGQASAASKAQDEVKAREEALEAREAEADRMQAIINESAKVRDARMRMQQLAAAHGGLEQQIAELHNSSDPDRANKIIDLQQQQKSIATQYSQTEVHMGQLEQQVKQENMAVQVERLNQAGYGGIVSDTQRREAIAEFGQANLDAEAFEFFNNNASALIILEKAMQVDKAKSKSAKGKLKGSKGKLTGRSVNKSAANQQSQKQMVSKMRSGHISEDEAAALRNSFVQDLLK